MVWEWVSGKELWLFGDQTPIADIFYCDIKINSPISFNSDFVLLCPGSRAAVFQGDIRKRKRIQNSFLFSPYMFKIHYIKLEILINYAQFSYNNNLKSFNSYFNDYHLSMFLIFVLAALAPSFPTSCSVNNQRSYGLWLRVKNLTKSPWAQKSIR